MVATDLYDNPDHEGQPAMLTSPETFAPFEYREDHLNVLRMSGDQLDFQIASSTSHFAFLQSNTSAVAKRNAKASRRCDEY
jgi:hypothetical protein